MTNENDLIRRGDAMFCFDDDMKIHQARKAIAAIPAATAHPVAVTVKPLVDALREAFNILEDALQEAGDDYPGSKMQEWCQQQVQHARQIRDAALRSITEDNA